MLKPPKQLTLFALRKREVVIGQLPVFLLQLAFYFIPTAFESHSCHSDNYFACESAIVGLRSLKQTHARLIQLVN